MPRNATINVQRPRGGAEPRYRFWGNQKPPKARQPVQASVSTSTGDESKATMRIYGPIDSWGDIWGVSANEVAEALDAMPDSVTQLDLHVNSPGGEVYEGLAITNLMRQHPANVSAYVDGLAASAGSFLVCGVDETFMAPNSQMMIHDAWGICIGPAEDMAAMGALLDKISGNIANVYKAKAGAGTDWRAAMLAETWYDADEAVSIGLADKVVGDDADEGDAAPANMVRAFDLSQFKYQGRANAPAPADAARPAPAALHAECGCGPDVAGMQHKDECKATRRVAADARKRRLALAAHSR